MLLARKNGGGKCACSEEQNHGPKDFTFGKKGKGKSHAGDSFHFEREKSKGGEGGEW